MSNLPLWRRYARILGPSVRDDVRDEISFHLDMRTRDLIARGMDPDTARAEALRRFGDVRGVSRECERTGRRMLRSASSRALVDAAREDVRHAFRTLRRNPAFSVLAIGTIALGIGATTAIFSVVDGVLLRPLPYPDADELVTIRLQVDLDEREDISFSDRGFWFFHDANRSFEHFGGFGTPQQMALVGDGEEPTQISVAGISGEALRALDVPPVLGRIPTEGWDTPGTPTVVLIGHGLWTERFGGDSALVGRSINLAGSDIEVVGVMPPDFDFPSPEIQAWYPYRLNPASENWEGHRINVVARLRDGSSIESARADASGLISRIGEAGYTSEWVTDVFTGNATIQTVKDGLVGASRRPLYAVFGTVGFLLLIAGGNLANLLLVRAEARSREVAVRAALGAPRVRLVGDVIFETLAIAGCGGLLGLLLAHWGTRILVAIGPTAIPRLDQIHTSANVLLFTTAVVLGTTLLTGLFPAFRVASTRPIKTLRGAGRGSTIGKDRHQARGLLVIVQVALTVVLVIGSGLMVRSFQKLRAIDPGFRSEGVLTFGVNLSGSRYREPASTSQFLEELFERLEALPTVSSSAAINTLPLTTGGAIVGLPIEDAPTPAGGLDPVFSIRRVTPGYFETMGIPVLEGRSFDRSDPEQRLGTAIVSLSLKDEFWAASSPLDRRIGRAIIVGVVGDVHDGSLTRPPEQIVYLPTLDGVEPTVGGGASRGWTVVVRTSSDPESLVPVIRRDVAALDPLLPIHSVQPMDALVAASMNRATFTMWILAGAACLALLLGAVGIFAVISYVTAQRTVEMSIRQVLGGSPTQVWGLILRHSLVLTLIGLVIGLFIAVLLRESLATLVYGIELIDPTSYVGGAALLLVVATVASLVPAMRASRVQPAVALRQD